MPVEFRQFTTVTSRANFCTFISNLDVPESILQPYIVRKIDAVTPRLLEENSMNSTINNSEEVEVRITLVLSLRSILPSQLLKFGNCES